MEESNDGADGGGDLLDAAKEAAGDHLVRASGLLRLFRSDLFNAWMALQYLHRQEQVGIHYYLCNRIRSLPLEDIEFVLPQLCHLAITRRVSSTPLECFLMDLCRKYVHMSAQLLWLLESYLHDFTPAKEPAHSKVHLRIVRLVREVQRASFSKDSIRCTEAGSGGVSSNRRRRSFNDDLELHSKDGVDELPSIPGTFLGFGVSLLSFGMLEAGQSLRPLALMEARTPHYSEVSAVMHPKDRRTALPGASTERSFQSPPNRPLLPTPFSASSPSIEELHKGTAFDSLQNMLGRTAKTLETRIARSIASKGQQRSKLPSLLYHAEMQFVTSLIEVSKRLCIVPSKHLRQKALHAELNLINHNLPASICVPFLCTQWSTHQHHNVIRIPSQEATILNSAERVPFLVFIEIVKGMSLEDLERIKVASRSDLTDTDVSPSSTSCSQNEDSSEAVDDLIEARTPVFPPSQSEDIIAERMRIAAIMLAQLGRQASHPGANLEEINSIRSKLLHDIELLEKDEMIEALSNNNNNKKSSNANNNSKSGSALFHEVTKVANSDAFNQPAVIRDDPSAAVFSEDWASKKERIRRASSFGQAPNWDLLAVIVKSGVDMRQEKFACQLVHIMQEIWTEEDVDCWTSPHHNVLVAASDGGLIEAIPNTMSVHSIKRASFSQRNNTVCSLKHFYGQKFGDPSGAGYKKAIVNFIKSLAGYSLVTYVLHIKDRHNGNILIDNEGHIVHIDFGFMLSNSPGGSYVGGFETAPFKLTADYIELLGGISQPASAEFVMFRGLLMTGLLAIRKHVERLVTLVECSMPFSTLPCLQGREAVLVALKSRLFLSATDRALEQHVDKIITSSAFNIFTRFYDSFQYYSNGIL